MLHLQWCSLRQTLSQSHSHGIFFSLQGGVCLWQLIQSESLGSQAAWLFFVPVSAPFDLQSLLPPFSLDSLESMQSFIVRQFRSETSPSPVCTTTTAEPPSFKRMKSQSPSPFASLSNLPGTSLLSSAPSSCDQRMSNQGVQSASESRQIEHAGFSPDGRLLAVVLATWYDTSQYLFLFLFYSFS